MAKTKLEEARRRWGSAAIIRGGAGRKPPPAPKHVPQGPPGSAKPPAA